MRALLIVVLIALPGCVMVGPAPECVATVRWMDAAVPAALHEQGVSPGDGHSESGLLLDGPVMHAWIDAHAHRIDVLAPDGGTYPALGAIEVDGRRWLDEGWHATVRFVLPNGTSPTDAGLDPVLAVLDLPSNAWDELRTPRRTIPEGDLYVGRVDAVRLTAPLEATTEGPLNNQEIVKWSAEGRDWVADVRVPYWGGVSLGDQDIITNGAGRTALSLTGDAPEGGILAWANQQMLAAGLPAPVDANIEVTFGDCGPIDSAQDPLGHT